MREHYKGKLFIIVSPSRMDVNGRFDYYRATWPGISSDKFVHGSKDGKRRSIGFKGADYNCISQKWNNKNIR